VHARAQLCGRKDSREMKDIRVITHGGFTGTVAEWAERLRLPLSTLNARLLRGMPLEKALTMPNQRKWAPPPGRMLEYQGERATIAQWAVRIGLSGNGLLHRLRRGRTVEEALTEPPHKMPARLYRRIEVNTVRCFFCKRVVVELKFLRTGVLKGAPICGAIDCSGEPQKTHPWRNHGPKLTLEKQL
jgi:hypothetical protein